MRNMRPLLLRCVTPAQSIADHEDDVAQHTVIVDARNAVGPGEAWLDAIHRTGKKPKLIVHDGSAVAALKSTQPASRKKFNGS
jgi:hypothetical protein